MRIPVLIVILTCATACATVGQGKTVPIAPAALATSQTIFLSSLGTDPGATVIREKLRASLIHGQRWRVTEDSARADVILAGSASNVEGQHKGTTQFAGTAVLRLVSSVSAETLWMFEYKRGWCYSCTVSTRVSSQVFQALEGIPESVR